MLSRCLTIITLSLLLASCSRVFFFPEKGIQQTPADQGYSYRSHWLQSADGKRINTWTINSPAPVSKGAILYFHGNSLNMGYHFDQIKWLVDDGYDVYMMDYRGFGESEGTPNLSDSHRDIKMATGDFLDRYPGNRPRFLLAQSLGATMAGYVIATEPELKSAFNAVVLDSGFTGFDDIARHIVGGGRITSWIWDFPMVLMTPQGRDLHSVIDRIAPTPLLIMHSTEDRLIPFKHAEVLYERAGEPKELVAYDNDVHLQTLFQNKARLDLARFMESSLTAEQIALQQSVKNDINRSAGIACQREC